MTQGNENLTMEELILDNRSLRARLEVAEQRLRQIGSGESERRHSGAESATWATCPQLQAVMDHIPAIVFVKDLDGRYLFINHQYATAFHITPGEFLGKTDHDLFPQSVADALRKNDLAVINLCQPQESEELVPQDGTDRTFSSLKFPLVDREGKAYAVCGVAQDVTDRRQAEYEQMKVAALVEKSDDFIGVASLDEQVNYLNAAGRCMVGLAGPNQTLNRSIPEFIAPEAQAELTQVILPCARTTGMWKGGCGLRHFQTGATIPVELTVFVINDPHAERPLAVAMVARDVTARKQADEALHRSYSELERRVQERTAELSKVNAGLLASEEHLRLLLDASGEAIFEVDHDLRCTLCNPAGARLLGFDRPEQLLGKNLHGVMHHTRPNGTPFPESECPVHDAVARKTVTRIDQETFWRVDGTCFPAEYRLYPLHRDGQHIGAVIWLTDLTERRKAEESLAERATLGSLIADTGMALTQEGDLKGLLQRCAEALVRHLDAAFARIWTLDARGDVLELQASAGMYTHLDGRHARVPVGGLKIGVIARDRKPYLTNQVVGDPRIDQEWARREGMVSFAGHPLIVGGKACGVMALFARHPLSLATLDALASVADEVAIGIIRIRSQEALRASEQTLRTITDTALDAVVLIDSTGRVRHWNPAAEKILGYSRDEILGRSVHATLAPPKYRDLAEIGLAHFASTGRGPVIGTIQRLEALHKNGSCIPIELSIAAMMLTGEWHAVGVLRDVTSQRRLDLELHSAKEAAEAANRAKGEFLANMSHEIRTPLNGILGMAELALGTELTAAQRNYLQAILDSGETLLLVINDILDFAKIEAGKLDFVEEDFSLDAALSQSMRTFAVRAGQKGLELMYQIAEGVPDGLRGDAGRLRQVIINLVGNAIKFTERGEIAVRVTAEPGPAAALLHFRVRDTGPGIPPGQQERIFQAFTQADMSISRRHGGTGLGLSISARLVEQMGGRIWVESEPGEGSTFHFTARFGLAHQPQGDWSREPPPLLQHLPVLVVDDNATNRHILGEMLSRWLLRPKVVEGGAAALAALRAARAAGEPFALALIDLAMPVMDGFSLVKSIRQDKDLSTLPVILLSSVDQAGSEARCRESKVERYLVKPIRPAELLQAVSCVLSPVKHVGQAQASSGPSPPSRQLRILLAEDNPINQLLAARLLEKRGHTVVAASNGVEALRRLEQQAFDLVLMDVQMPDMDGFAATQALRQRELGTGRHLPVIAMTAHAMKGDREACLAAGMDDYVTKPITSRDLNEAIARVVPVSEPLSDKQTGEK